MGRLAPLGPICQYPLRPPYLFSQGLMKWQGLKHWALPVNLEPVADRFVGIGVNKRTCVVENTVEIRLKVGDRVPFRSKLALLGGDHLDERTGPWADGEQTETGN